MDGTNSCAKDIRSSETQNKHLEITRPVYQKLKTEKSTALWSADRCVGEHQAEKENVQSIVWKESCNMLSISCNFILMRNQINQKSNSTLALFLIV